MSAAREPIVRPPPGATIDPGSILVVKVLSRRRWLDHAVLVAWTSAAGGTSGDDPIDMLRPVRRAALPDEIQRSASARGSRAGLRGLHQRNPGNAIRRRTEAVRLGVSGGLGPHLAAEVLAREREETVRSGLRERSRCRAQGSWRPLSSRMPNAWPASQAGRKDGNGGNADAGLPAAGSRAGSSANHPPRQVATTGLCGAGTRVHHHDLGFSSGMTYRAFPIGVAPGDSCPWLEEILGRRQHLIRYRELPRGCRIESPVFVEEMTAPAHEQCLKPVDLPGRARA